MKSRSGMIERSDSNAFRDCDIPEVQIPSWGIGNQQAALDQVSFLHLRDTKLMKRFSPARIESKKI